MRRVADAVRRESMGPSADFWQRIRAGIIGFAVLLIIFWVAK